MPRPKSGNPLWEPIAFKLPKAQLLELRRFADLHHKNISDVLREGLEMRMAHDGVTLPIPSLQRKEYNGYTHVSDAGESPPDTSAILQEIREQLQVQGAQLQAQGDQLHALSNVLAHREPRPMGQAPPSPPRSPARPPGSGAPDVQPPEPKPRWYGDFTRQVWESAVQWQRFTCKELATGLDAEPKHIWQVLQKLVKRGVLVQESGGKGACYHVVQSEER